MEVVDSHMSEHFSAQAPTHIDIDMSPEYDDDAEYAMHDVTEATTTTNDEEIYDAEFEELPEQTEIEMDEYADEVEVVEDNESHMGTYVPTDDAATVTDVTVEDVQLRSSPVPEGTPHGVMRPISPHVSVTAGLLNEVSADALAQHSPHSVATLVDDSEAEPLPDDSTKEGILNEVIDLTGGEDEPQIVSVATVEEATSVELAESTDQEATRSEHEVLQVDHDTTEQEFYDAEEPAFEIPSIDSTVPEQLVEQRQEEQPSEDVDQYEDVVEVPTHLEIPEQADDDGHSPIEEALVINQQVRDDAADSMEPSPPVRLYYRDEGKGTDKIFEIFAPTGLESHEAELLFHDNRTLFYEPLSTFFAKLREIEHFSSDGWEDVEMSIRMDLEDSSISINEDHKETENISLFRLSFIWSGLGLEEPLELTLVRRSERFTVQMARLIEQVEQRYFHAEGPTDHHGVAREIETGANPEIDGDNVGNVDTKAITMNNQEKSRAPIESDDVPGSPPRGVHTSDTDEDAQAIDNTQPNVFNEQPRDVDDSDERDTVQEAEVHENPEEVAQDILALNGDLTKQTINPTHQDPEADDTDPNPSNGESTVNDGQSPSASTPQPQEDDYDEYETEGANAPAPAQTSIQNEALSTEWDANEYDYEEDYGGDEKHSKHTLPGNTPNEPTDSDQAHSSMSAPKVSEHESQNTSLKRNLDELEYEEYETPSAPSSPASDHKRIKHT
ncbi:hypothetical protein RHS03_09397, partial [Rhizoctonia solani]